MPHNQEINDELSRESAKDRYVVSTAILSAAKEYLKKHYVSTYTQILNKSEVVFDKLSSDKKLIIELSKSFAFGISQTRLAMALNEYKNVAESLINHKFLRCTENDVFVIESRRLLVFSVLAFENNNINWGSSVCVRIASLTKNTKRNLQSVLTLCGLHETKANTLATLNLQIFNITAGGDGLFQNVYNQQINLQNPLKTREFGRIGQKDQKKKLAISLISAAKMAEHAIESLCISLMRKNKKHVVRDINKCLWMCTSLMRCGRGEDSGQDRMDALMTKHGESGIPDIPMIAAQLQLDCIDSLTPLIEDRTFCHFRCFSKTTDENKQKRDTVIKHPLPESAGIICPIRLFIVLFRVLMEVHELKGDGKTFFKCSDGTPSSMFISSATIKNNIIETETVSLQNIGDSVSQLFRKTFDVSDTSVRLYMARNALARETAKAGLNVDVIKAYFRHSKSSRQIKAYDANSVEFPKGVGPATEMEYALHNHNVLK